jgi:hypothetical protein
MEMGDENGIELQIPDLDVVEPDLGKGVAIPAEGVFEDRVEGDLRAVAREDVAGVKYPGDVQSHVINK